MKAVVVFVVVLIVLSLSAFSPPMPACPDPTPTVPTAVQFTDFHVRQLAPGMIGVWFNTVSEVDYGGAYVIMPGRGSEVVILSQFLPAQWPGQPIPGQYFWIIRTPILYDHPCFGLEWTDLGGVLSVWWSGVCL